MSSIRRAAGEIFIALALALAFTFALLNASLQSVVFEAAPKHLGKTVSVVASAPKHLGRTWAAPKHLGAPKHLSGRTWAAPKHLGASKAAAPKHL